MKFLNGQHLSLFNRIILTICIVSFLFLTASNAQEILNKSYPHKLLDRVEFHGIEYSLELNGWCQSGNLTYKGISNPLGGKYYYTHSSKFKMNDSVCYALTNHMHSDDVGPRFVSITKINRHHEIEVGDGIQSYNEWYIDFTQLSDSSFAIIPESGNNKRIDVLNSKTRLIKSYSTPIQYSFIDKIGNTLVAGENFTLYQLNEDFKSMDTLELSDYIVSIRNINDQLIVLTQTEIFIINNQFKIVFSTPTLERFIPTDVNLINDTIYSLNQSGYTSSINRLDSSLIWEEVNNEKFSHQYFTKFVTGNNNRGVIGYQDEYNFNSFNHRNGISTSISNLNRETNDYAISISKVIEYLDTTGFVILGNGDTLYRLSSTLYFDYTITNNSKETLNSCYIVSNSKHVFNCGVSQYQEYFPKLNLAPNESVTLSRSYPFYLRMNPLCLYLISGNNNYDTQFENNSSCMAPVLPVRSVEPNKVKVFPNPFSGLVNIESDIEVSQVSAYNISGIKLDDFSIVGNQIDLSTLVPGIYLLNIIDKSGIQSSHRIVKQ